MNISFEYEDFVDIVFWFFWGGGGGVAVFTKLDFI